MLTGFETKQVIAAAGDAAMRPQAPVTVVDGNGSAVIVGRAEAVATIPPRTGEASAFTRACASPNRSMSRSLASTHAPQTPAKQGGGF